MDPSRAAAVVIDVKSLIIHRRCARNFFSLSRFVFIRWGWTGTRDIFRRSKLYSDIYIYIVRIVHRVDLDDDLIA